MYKIIIIVLLTPILLFGSAKIDSLRIQLEKVSGIDKVNTLHELAEEYMDSSPNIAIELSNKALSLSEMLNNNKAVYYSIYLIGKAYNISGDYKKAESVLREIIETKSEIQIGTDHIPVLFELGKNQYFLSKYNSSLKYFQELNKVTSVNNYENWKALSQDVLGSIYYAQSNFIEALKYHYKSLELYRNLKDNESIAGSFYSIGADYTGLSMYDKAIEYYLYAINLSEMTNNNKILAMSNHAIGMTYQELKNYKQSLEYNFKALSIANNSGDYDLKASILTNIGLVKLSEQNYDSALVYFLDGLAINQKIKSRIGMATSYDNIGLIHFKQDSLYKALYYGNKALSISKSIEEKWRNSRIQNHLGLYYLNKQKFNISLSHLNKSLAFASSIKAQDLVQDNLSALSEFYAATNDYKKAYEYLMRFSQLRDSITTQSSHNIAEMQMRYEKGKQEKEKQILLDKIHIQGLEIERIRLERWLTALSFTLFSLISFWGYSRFQVKKRANIILEQRIDQAMMEQEEQQKIIFHQASLSSLGELAASMAHEINQPLQNLKLCAEYVELYMRESGSTDTSLIKSIEEIYHDIERIKQIIDHVRTFSSQQKNYVNELFTVGSVIDYALSMIGKQCVKHGIFLNLDLKKNIGKIKGNPYKLEQVLINVLTNAKDAVIAKEKKLQGSIDKQLIIRTYKKEVNIVIEIIDSGVGIKPELQEAIFKPFYTTKVLGEGTGLGLSIVKEIVKEFDGEISIESEYMKGTTVKIQIPRYMQNSENRKTFKVKKSKSS